MNNYSKKNLPYKLCVKCKRPFYWRKKWKNDWENVLYCSKKCSKKNNTKV
ncbi:MAG: hypothetical protein CMG00_01015 [Candidatus Marinimicrobia bacterium]|nr:hypothetical protein [Candidatus Neomarinimicrobiota bacterium]